MRYSPWAGYVHRALPQTSISGIFLFIKSLLDQKQYVNRKNIGMNFMLTPFFSGTTHMTFHAYRTPNLRGDGWYIVHYISVDCLSNDV